MYLTRAFLNPGSRAVREDLHSPESLHKTVMRAFPDDSGPSARAAHGVLHRLDQEPGGRLVLLLQSRTRPDTARWMTGYLLELGSDIDLALSNVGDNPATRDVTSERSGLQVESRFVFRLRANTTRKIDTKSGPDGVKRNGKRVPVRGDEERLRWLERHASSAGFAVDRSKLRISEIAASVGRGRKSMTVAGAMFEGVLLVRDVDRFRAALEVGIGPAKAYGFGLLSIARMR